MENLEIPIKEQNINKKINEPKIIYEELTNPVKDADGNIIEHARYLDAETFEEQVQECGQCLAKNKRLNFIFLWPNKQN